MELLNFILQIACATMLVLVCILLARHARSGQNTWTGIGLTVSIFCYIIVESVIVQSVPGLRFILSIGAISIPVMFWLLTRAMFDDHFKFRFSLLYWLLVLLTPHLMFMNGDQVSWPAFRTLAGIVARLTSLAFVMAGLYITVRTKPGDLVDARIRFRNTFLTGTATLIVITLIVETVPIQEDITSVLQALQRSAILTITIYFLLTNFWIRTGFFFKEIPKPKMSAIDDPQLMNKLKMQMEELKVFKKEGLTITQLAALMNEQEYRLRRLINGQLGFRNFNDFVNQYRVNEACEILSDPTQARKTILEIAYDMGYQSIGPFNKAFKALKGVTPTAYRKSQVA